MEAFDLATPGVFAAARSKTDEVEDTGGLRCEMKSYEARIDSDGEKVMLQSGVKRMEKPLKTKDHDSAFILTRSYTKNMVLDFTELEIQSPYVKTAPREVIKTYPGMTFDAGRMVIRDQPRCLFHYRNELRHYGIQQEDQTAVEHIAFILNYMYMSLENEMSSYYTLMESSSSVEPGIEYDNLWMAFRPGELIFTQLGDSKRVLKLQDMTSYNGKWILVNAGKRNSLQWGEPLVELTTYPLRYYTRGRERLTSTLMARAKKFLGLGGLHHRYYDGTARTLSPIPITSYEGEEDRYPVRSMRVKGRIIVDSAKFAEARPTHVPYFGSDSIIMTKEGETPHLCDEDLLICDHEIAGFSLTSKRWCYFHVDLICEFKYNTSAFGSLLLAPAQKKMICSLVKIHKDEQLRFDDFIAGKGKGMVFLLHGEPGVGKTLTAESVADYTERPLYTISSGDLGTEAEDVECKLVEALELAAHWNAIVLIDEADVLLEQRSHHDLARNGLVSGIMILTTNRIHSFDDAFKSRIHLAIKYPALSTASRKELWTSFITNVGAKPLPPWWNAAFLDSIAAQALNGRQIKNVIRTAFTLAIAEEVEIRPEDIRVSLQSITDFDQDFKHGEMGADEEPTHKRRRIE